MRDTDSTISEAIALLDRIASEPLDMLQTREDAREAADSLRALYCTGCGALSEDCSADPCADVIADRKA